ncbi:DUF1800 domain-containing protein [Vibrio coralliilyticus]|uniref:DUF1800 domain-containing protein n=1 Tax=Vibrio coralliilyticus TaxID=190893 RepID=UPI0006CC97D0|nr:DUF1800 family protein [Vibrio coralliilyticus]AXN33766.1 DUF1800 family protein [Vibrio coralliilyticus]KPH24692.1 hypothetical protein ADU60_25260 [Vibrio coralliilyticus]
MPLNYKLSVILLLNVLLTAACQSSEDEQANEGALSTNTHQNWHCQSSDTSHQVRFLNQSTFGANRTEVARLCQLGQSQWFLNQLDERPSYLMPYVQTELAQADRESEDELSAFVFESPTFGFWTNAIAGNDQLRQRMAFALSEIFVISTKGGEVLAETPTAIARYQDLLIKHAFGNYRTLLDDITYSATMGYYLTYIGSKKADPATGRVPDENYARELLQLFSIGVTLLNQDGTQKTDSQGKPVEAYNNQDITGLAKVFTGFDLDVPAALDEDERHDAWMDAALKPMIIRTEDHSQVEKHFLGKTLAANTPARQTIQQALDHIFAHPNVAPFFSTQLIKRLTSSNPSPAYVKRVADSFDAGWYTLPNGQVVGTRQRGDLGATLAAILFDPETRQDPASQYGKLREPILTFTQWARAFEIRKVTPQFKLDLWSTDSADALSQHPYRSPSVFNYFRPGYVPPGSHSADMGLTAPEMQLINASSLPGYSNFLTHFIFNNMVEEDIDDAQAELAEEGKRVSRSQVKQSFHARYQYEYQLARHPDKLVQHLDLLLTGNRLSTDTKRSIATSINELDSNEDRLLRVQLAILMVMTSPDYLFQY